jgi:expansin (peptidoglycan-binding protein)
MNCADKDRTGKVTYYNEANGSGACSFDPSPNDLMIGAMNAPDYMDSAACGACALIRTMDGSKSVTVRIVDLCPECQTGHIDLSPQAFQQLGDLALGVIPTTWHYVSCDYQGPIQYKFKEGSNQWWTAVQIRHHSNRIAKFEYDKGGGNWVSVARTSYNYFVEDKGMGPGPYHFRVTDIFGQTVEDEGIPFGDGSVVDGKANFPPCAQ